MFFRRKAVGERTYLQIVESRRDGSSVRQHVVATLGRAEEWLDAGKLDQLLQSGARLSETTLVLSALRDGDGLVVDSRRLGPSLIFERLWRETGCQAVIEKLLADRKFEFPVERAIFASVLHRLCISGSDRACDKWLAGYRVAGLDGLDLHHLYRAIAWLGEELADQEGRTRAPRAIKDLVEERLFARRRDLFNDLDLVFFDTSALYFHGEGGETLGRRGQAENHIKAWKTHLAADRTSCPKATANQFRLFLHAGAYWLLWSLRALMPRRSSWRAAQFDTLRLRLIKTAARIVQIKTRIKVHLPTSAPDQAICHLALGRLPRLLT